MWCYPVASSPSSLAPGAGAGGRKTAGACAEAGGPWWRSGGTAAEERRGLEVDSGRSQQGRRPPFRPISMETGLLRVPVSFPFCFLTLALPPSPVVVATLLAGDFSSRSMRHGLSATPQLALLLSLNYCIICICLYSPKVV
uniref:Uncharacterized protein n=1 Tax=Setaria italica TaxID=4555 RepID=K3ZAL3_SETIT